MKRVATLENKAGVKYTLAVVATMIISLIILIINPVADEWFYIAATVSILGMLSNCFGSIYYFNYLTTRPVPNFFARQGGHNYESVR